MYSYAKVSNAMNGTGVSPGPLLTAPSPINFTTTCTAQVGLTTFLSPTTPLATMSYETTTAVAIDHTHPMFTEHADWRTVNSYLQDTQDLLTSLSGGTLPVSLPVSKTFLPDTLTSLTVTLPPTTYTLATPGTAPSSVTVSGIDHDLLTTYTLPLAVTITTPPSTTATLTSRIAAALSNGDGVAITVASDDDTFLTAAAGNVHDVVLTESMYADGTGIGRVKEMTVVVDGGMPVVVGTDHDKGLVTVGCGGETLTIGARSQPRARALSIYNDDDVEEEEFIQGWLDYDPNYDNDEGDVLEQLEDLANDLEDLIPGEHSTWSDLKYFVEQVSHHNVSLTRAAGERTHRTRVRERLVCAERPFRICMALKHRPLCSHMCVAALCSHALRLCSCSALTWTTLWTTCRRSTLTLTCARDGTRLVGTVRLATSSKFTYALLTTGTITVSRCLMTMTIGSSLRPSFTTAVKT